ncbi:hypothetical protein DSO57_1030743 [Entomophthora muscae]|uniref:Uncharacterized protein n=1 Tax=Entomophthora muscae TaxID=34485 RepID=A0ACC2RRX1_9FUNG|nr:hypothetical protein DSO57_1030743 [Entomophthora muscae]
MQINSIVALFSIANLPLGLALPANNHQLGRRQDAGAAGVFANSISQMSNLGIKLITGALGGGNA